MVGGGGNRKNNESSNPINNSNVFAALDTLRKKKSKDKSKSSGSTKGSSKGPLKELEVQPPLYWQPAPLTNKSWADVDDEDDDDYYNTTAPLPSVWAPQPGGESSAHVEESESEDDLLDLGDEEVEDEHEHEHETEALVDPEPVAKKAPETLAAPKETERQLSKKERKKKELEELDAILADFGIQSNNGEGAAQDSKTEEQKKEGELGNGETKDNTGGASEPKNAKKKKKKDKASKESKEALDQPNSSEAITESNESEQADEDAASLDVKERLKKVASLKKKKSSKEMAPVKAAASEAAARSAKLAAAKKKEKNHYNQQPVR